MRVSSHFGRIVRATEWWEYKLIPIVAAFYATAVFLRVSIAALWPAGLLLLVSMIPGAAFVSVINDWADRDEDRAAAKANRLANASGGVVAALVALTFGAGIAFMTVWRDDPFLLDAYAAAWVAFMLYSLPPFRFKTRGFAGVLCDAAGSSLFPMLVAVLVVFRSAARPLDAVWIASVAAWSLAFGLRGILWHQLSDYENDSRAGVRTFAVRRGPRVAASIGAYAAYPIELIAFTSMLRLLRAPWTIVALLVYLLLARMRVRVWNLAGAIVAARRDYFLVLHEYYLVFFPLALLVTAAMRRTIDVLPLAVHVIVFPGQISRTLTDIWKLRPRALRFASGPR